MSEFLQLKATITKTKTTTAGWADLSMEDFEKLLKIGALRQIGWEHFSEYCRVVIAFNHGYNTYPEKVSVLIIRDDSKLDKPKD